MSNLVNDWQEETYFTVEELIEEDIKLKEVAEEVGDWSYDRKLNLILDVLNEEAKQRNNSRGDKLTKTLTGVIRLKRANTVYRKKLGYLEN